MRAVLQRVLSASVTVNAEKVAAIGNGLLVLAAFHADDTDDDIEYIISKTLNTRIFDNDRGVMDRSLVETGGGLLLVSQFTLYGDMRKGRRPSYSLSMKSNDARRMYSTFVERCTTRYPKTVSGIFGADMTVSLVNDGPVTIILDSSRIL